MCDLGIKLTRRHGSEKTFCPKCHDGRKNKRDRSLSVNVTTGVYKCHNTGCDFQGNVRSFERKRENKTYLKPPQDVLNSIEIKEKAAIWFAKRGISRKTLDKFMIFCREEWMPQTQKKESCICFPYLRDGSLVNVKYRDGRKNFKMVKDAELILFNLNTVGEKKYCIITEGECFHPNAEVLTSNGWIKISNWDGEDIAQFNEDETVSFVRPLSKIEKDFDGDLYEYSNKQKFYSLTTPKHNLVLWANGKLSKRTADNMPDDSRFFIPRVAIHNGVGLSLLDDEIKLAIAVSADFTIRETGDIYGRLKKERKKERLIKILNNLKIEYSCNIDSHGYYSFFIKKKNAPKYLFKKFPPKWIYESSLNQKKLIINEILHWDGNSVPNRAQIEYSTIEIENAIFIQTISTLCGFCSTIIPRQSKLGKWFKVSILFTKTKTSTQGLRENKNLIKYKGKVHCLEVPSGMLLVRQNNCISVSGNCDTMAVYEVGFGVTPEVNEATGELLNDDYSKWCVVSVPNGASMGNQRLDYLDNCAEWLVGIEVFVIATDGDQAGEELKQELIRRLGVERCKTISYPIEECVQLESGLKRRCKDLNEVLIHLGPEVVKNIINNAESIPVDGIYYVDDIFHVMLQNFKNGIQLAPKTHFGEMDEYFRWKKGEINLFVGWANMGKTTLVLQMMLTKSFYDGWKWAIFSPENYPAVDFYDDLIEMYVGKWLDKMTEDEYTKGALFIDEHIFYVYPDDGHDIHSIHEKFRYLVLKKGVDGVLIDPFNQLDRITTQFQREDLYLSDILKDIKRFSLLNSISYNIVAHPAKQSKQEDKSLPPVDMYDIAGGAMWANKADNIISYYRPNHHVDKTSPEVQIYVQKIKRRRTGGKPGDFPMKMKWEIKRFVDPINEFPYLNPQRMFVNNKDIELRLPYADDISIDDLPF